MICCARGRLLCLRGAGRADHHLCGFSSGAVTRILHARSDASSLGACPSLAGGLVGVGDQLLGMSGAWALRNTGRPVLRPGRTATRQAQWPTWQMLGQVGVGPSPTLLEAGSWQSGKSCPVPSRLLRGRKHLMPPLPCPAQMTGETDTLLSVMWLVRLCVCLLL